MSQKLKYWEKILGQTIIYIIQKFTHLLLNRLIEN